MTATLKAGDMAIEIYGKVPSKGQLVPDFTLTNKLLEDVSLKDFAGKPILMSLFPSIDTPVCACSVFETEKIAKKYPGIQVLCLSADLPFAQEMFFQSEGIKGHQIPLSTFRSPEFGKNYGVGIKSGPMRGLLARSVFLVNKEHKVHYLELVQNMLNEPDYVLLQKAVDSL